MVRAVIVWDWRLILNMQNKFALRVKYFWKTDREINYIAMRNRIERYKKLGAIIGDNVRLWGNLDNVNPQLIYIGNNVCLAENSRIITHCPINSGRVMIDDNAWIGYGAIILPNVEIGYGALVGAYSVVTNNARRMSIVAGNPAKYIRERDIDEMEITVNLIKNDLPVGKL